LIVKTVPPLVVGMAQGQITLKTSSTNLPVLIVPALANVQPAKPAAQPATPAPSNAPTGTSAAP